MCNPRIIHLQAPTRNVAASHRNSRRPFRPHACFVRVNNSAAFFLFPESEKYICVITLICIRSGVLSRRQQIDATNARGSDTSTDLNVTKRSASSVDRPFRGRRGSLLIQSIVPRNCLRTIKSVHSSALRTPGEKKLEFKYPVKESVPAAGCFSSNL